MGRMTVVYHKQKQDKLETECGLTLSDCSTDKHARVETRYTSLLDICMGGGFTDEDSTVCKDCIYETITEYKL